MTAGLPSEQVPTEDRRFHGHLPRGRGMAPGQERLTAHEIALRRDDVLCRPSVAVASVRTVQHQDARMDVVPPPRVRDTDAELDVLEAVRGELVHQIADLVEESASEHMTTTSHIGDRETSGGAPRD